MESLLNAYKCTEASKATHLSMVGGKFGIPDPDRFHRIYTKMHVQGAHLVEKVCYPSKWYLDFDKIDTTFVRDVLVPRLCAFGQACVVCVCRDTWDGAHVIFQDVVVQNKTEACAWSDRFVQHDKRLIYDASVYASGLRMIGSKKSKTVARVYTPYATIDAQGNVSLSDGNITVGVLRMCSIHTNNSDTFPKNENSFNELPTNKNSFNEFPKNKNNSEKNDSKEFPKNIKQMDNGYYYWFTKDRYCENVGREHKSANRMYELNPGSKQMRVRCSCKCPDTGCNLYRGPWYPAPIKLLCYIQNTNDTKRCVSHSAYNLVVPDPDGFLENLFGGE